MALSKERINELDEVVKQLLIPGKGIMVIDNHSENLIKMLRSAELPPRSLPQFRQLISEVPSMKEYISAVAFAEDWALYEFTEHTLKDKFLTGGFVVGLQFNPIFAVIHGTAENYSQGMDNLYSSLSYYYHCGFRFFEWRCILTITKTTPSQVCININANILARFASLCQKEGSVPILQPDISWEGTHTLAHCEKVTEQFLKALMKALDDFGVYIKGVILKPNIVTCGKQCTSELCDLQVSARATLIALRRAVPPAVPGIAFSTNSLREDAIICIKMMNSMTGPVPWMLTFNVGQVLYAEALTYWSFNPDCIHGTKKQFVKTLQKFGRAAQRSEHDRIEEDDVRIPVD